MPKFIERARTNEAFVVYTFGIPHVTYKWTFLFPCIRKTHRVNIAFQTVKMETDYIWTADGQQVGLTAFAKYRIDANSKQKVIKAFNSYSGKEGGENEMTSLITDAISDVQEKLVGRITRDELLNFTTVFGDEVFRLAAEHLRSNGVELVDLKLDEVKEYKEVDSGEEEIEGVMERKGDDILFVPDTEERLNSIREKLKNEKLKFENEEVDQNGVECATEENE